MGSHIQRITNRILLQAEKHRQNIASRGAELAHEILNCNLSFVACGIGTSSFSAMKLAHLLNCYGIQAQYRDVLELGHGQLGALNKGDTLCAFTLSGQTREVVDLFIAARRKGLRCVAVCARPKAPISDVSDHLIAVDFMDNVDPDHGIATVSSSLLSFVIAEACSAISEARPLSADTLLVNHPFGNVAERIKRRGKRK